MLRNPSDERRKASKSPPPPVVERPKAASARRKVPGRAKARRANVSEAIVITPANLIPNQINVIPPPPEGYRGRALLWPPPAPGERVAPARPDEYTFALYAGRSLGPVAVHIPNIQGFLFADLKDGVLPPSGEGETILDAIEAAINAQVEPPPPEGTGNDVPI
jgi:hypothetical protein